MPPSVCMCSAAIAATVFPAPLIWLGALDSRLAEEFVVGVPEDSWSDFVLVYTTWNVLETSCNIPSEYKPTILERVLIMGMGLEAGVAFAPAPAMNDNGVDVGSGSWRNLGLRRRNRGRYPQSFWERWRRRSRWWRC